MKLDSIALRDFRGISNVRLPIDENLTVIVGDNGIGKTSILDAIYLSLFGLRSFWPDKVGQPKHHIPPVESSDIAVARPDFMIKTCASINLMSGGKENVAIDLCGNGKKNVPGIVTLSRKGLGLGERLPNHKPLFVYYRQNRGFTSNIRPQSANLISEDQVREQSLSKDLHAIQDLSLWWDKLDAQEARRHRDEEPGYRDPQLEAVRKLTEEMDEFEAIGYEAKLERPGLYLKKTMGPRLHVEQLSSGERAYLILLADLARRLQVVQPDAELADIPGIVLIDEIELNLHPNWQRRIMPTLTRVFKRCQFIVTTHSPQVLGEIKNGRILVLSKNLEGDIECGRSRPTFGRDSNDILIDVLSSTDRDKSVKMKLDTLESLISKKELGEARNMIDQLRSEFGGRLVELEIAEQRLRRRERRPQE